MLEIIKKLVGEKKEYRNMMARVKALPQDYRFVFDKIQKYMWQFAAGDGYDILDIHMELIDLFEAGAADGKPVLEITGEDIASFCDELLLHAKTYTNNRRQALNRDIQKKLGSKRQNP